MKNVIGLEIIKLSLIFLKNIDFLQIDGLYCISRFIGSKLSNKMFDLLFLKFPRLI